MKSKKSKIKIYPRQWPTIPGEDKKTTPYEAMTEPQGFGSRSTSKFNEGVSYKNLMVKLNEAAKLLQHQMHPPGMKYTLGRRIARVGGVRRGHPIAAPKK